MSLIETLDKWVAFATFALWVTCYWHVSYHKSCWHRFHDGKKLNWKSYGDTFKTCLGYNNLQCLFTVAALVKLLWQGTSKLRCAVLKKDTTSVYAATWFNWLKAPGVCPINNIQYFTSEATKTRQKILDLFEVDKNHNNRQGLSQENSLILTIEATKNWGWAPLEIEKWLGALP